MEACFISYAYKSIPYCEIDESFCTCYKRRSLSYSGPEGTSPQTKYMLLTKLNLLQVQLNVYTTLLTKTTLAHCKQKTVSHCKQKTTAHCKQKTLAHCKQKTLAHNLHTANKKYKCCARML